MSTIDELSCKELVELVTDYLEATLPPDQRARFERHLSYCGPCTNYVQQMRLTIKMLGKLTEDDLDPQARDELMKTFRDWKAHSG